MGSGKLKTGCFEKLQRELTIMAGNDVSFDRVLDRLLQAVYSELDLLSMHVYGTHSYQQSVLLAKDKSTLESTLLACMPDTSRKHPHQYDQIVSVMIDMDVKHWGVYEKKLLSNLLYVVYPVNDFGYVVITARPEQLPEIILDELISMLHHFSLLCKLYSQHEKLLSEVEARSLAEKAYELLSTRDALTNLPNKRVLEYRLYSEVQEAKKRKYINALVYIDLDAFKNVNNSLGHSFGDRVLIRIATRLKETLRESDEVFRIGGDEFVILVCNLGADFALAEKYTTTMLSEIKSVLSKPIMIEQQTVLLTCSMGVVLFPGNADGISNDSTSSTELLDHADTAMFSVKASGKNGVAFYSREMKILADKRLIIESSLRHAIDNYDLYMVYQPIVNASGQVVAAEALVRWNSSVLGEVSPVDFIPVAEETGLIIDLGDWVLRSACVFIKSLQLETVADINYISVNVSQKQFRQPDFVSRIKEIISQSGISPNMIRLEFTESIVIESPDDIFHKVKELNNFGVLFLLDDFGTGYSSLAYLQYLPIETLKIDKSFIAGIDDRNDSSKAIVDTIVSMVDIMRINCIAEGVETLSDVEYCIKKKMYAMQGYFFSKPVTKEAFMQILTKNNFKEKIESINKSNDGLFIYH